MDFADIALIGRWVLAFWLLGWLVFPFSRRLFGFLPDCGLAAGRLLAFAGVCLLGFWFSTLGIMPLSFAVLCLLGIPLFLAYLGWPSLDKRAIWRENRRAFLISDAIFLLAFAFFLWIRLRNPAIGDLEKPMDALLISGAARTNALPFENPWLSGELFTNYYYFGPTMGAIALRALGTPIWFAYNLIQPLFCAFFLSVLWSLAAALTNSKRLGVLAMLLVGIGGHLEPLRQLKNGKTLMELDWWTTSRVFNVTSDGVQHTINEYPAFTQIIGDLHAHFYALALAVLHFCVCLGIIQTPSNRARRVFIVAGGFLLAIFALGNTWDAPLYGLLWGFALLWANQRGQLARVDWAFVILSVISIPILAAPFFLKFHAPVSGVQRLLWMPDAPGFLLFWGVWLGLGWTGFVLAKAPHDESEIFRRALLILGVVAIVAPFFFYIKGAFGDGDFAHQDTVFKFWLQGWLLGGTAIACQFLVVARSWWRQKTWARPVLTVFGLGLSAILALAPLAVVHARAFVYGGPQLSLNGMEFLPQSDQKAVEWLATQSGNIVEGLKLDEKGNPGGDYDPQCGRFAALTGNPTILGWPGHIGQWGQNAGMRADDVLGVYRGDAEQKREILKRYGARWVIYGPFEQQMGPPTFSDDFSVQEFAGDDGSKTQVFERRKF